MDSFFNQEQKKYQVLCTKYQVGIRFLTQIFLLRHLGTCLPVGRQGTLYLVQKKATYS
jgi:hypothetical protein